MSQFANSPIILALVSSYNSAVDPSVNVDSFYNNVWNIETAQGYGLDVWGRILSVSRILHIPVSATRKMGFEEQSGSTDAFNVSPFNGGAPITTNYYLSDTAYRSLLLVKALANISRTTIPLLNQLLMQLFAGRGNVYVNDTGGMAMQLVFHFALEPFEVAILKSGVFPNPTGVQINVIDINAAMDFGFAEAASGYGGFNSGIFFKGYE